MSQPPPSYGDSGAYPPQGPPQGFGVPGMYPPAGGGMYPPQGGGGMYPPAGGGMYPPQPGAPGPGGPGFNGGYAPVKQNDGSPMDTYPPQGGHAAPMMPPMIPRLPIQGGGFSNPQTDEESGPKEGDGLEGSNWAGRSFSDKAIRRAFIKKVYLILMTQLLLTAAFVAFFLFHLPTKNWVQRNQWFYWVSYAIFLVTYITLVCCPGVRRSYPANFICLAIFTLAFSYMTGTITSFYDTEIILIAVGITAAVCLAITLFAMQTKFDFTMCGGLLFVGSMVLFFFGIACIIVYSVSGPNYILHCVYAGLAALLFSLFLAYDTQMLMGGKKYELSPEEYIFGALQLYLDIVQLFLIILSLFGSSD